MVARLILLLCAVLYPVAADAQPVTHPIWAVTPDASWDGPARAQFEKALAKRGFASPETVAIPLPPTPDVVHRMDQGMTALRASSFDKASTLLGEAATMALAAGGAGLPLREAASLFFHQAMAIQLAAGETYSEPFTAITPPEAKTAYLRAAVLGGNAALDEETSQPLVEASWRMAKSLVATRPRTTLTVHARPRTRISLACRPAQPAPATFSDLPPGEHFILVEEPGHAAWSTTLEIGGASNSIDVPATPLLVYDAAAAAARAQAVGAAFALVGQLHLGDKLEIDLRLVNGKTAEVRASTAVALAESADSPALVAAVLRLDETAAQADLARRAAGADGQPRVPLDLAPPPARTAKDGPTFTDDSRGWLHRNWPLATAIGTAIGTAFTLGIVVAGDRR